MGSVPLTLGDKWFDKFAVQSLLGTLKAIIIVEIDERCGELEVRGTSRKISWIQGHTMTRCTRLSAQLPKSTYKPQNGRI